MFQFISTIIIFIFFMGCSTLPQKVWTQSSRDSSNSTEGELKEIEIAEKLFSEGKYTEAKEKFIEFQKKYPQSVYFQSARLAEGQCSENLGNPEKAGEIYDSVILNTQSIHPQIAAMAIFRKSFVYERLGDDLKALTTLLDLKIHQDQLPMEVAMIQMPGRMAMLYNKMGQNNEGEKYIQIMNQNIEVNLKGKISKEQLADSYLLMGTLSTASVNESNLAVFVRGFKVSSIFLIKSIEANQKPWSDKACDLLSQQMKDYWNWITISGPRESASKQGTNRRAAIEKQQQLAQDFLEALSVLELRRPGEKEQWTELQKKLYSQLDLMQKNTQSLVAERPELNEFSPEYLRANGIKRSGRLAPVPDSKFSEPKTISNPVTK